MLAATLEGHVAFGDKIGVSPSRVSQLIGIKPTKNIGNATARLIEVEFGKPVGWLDVPHDDAEPEVLVELDAGLVDPALIAEIITLYAQSNELGRNTILDSARVTAKLAPRHNGGHKAKQA